MPRRNALIPLLTAALLLLLTGCAAEQDSAATTGNNSPAPAMVVYKSPTCSCCDAWVTHVREAGFTVTTHDLTQAELNQKKHEGGVGYGMASCHTAFIEGYTIEGHVPADEIRRLLEQRPDIAGLTVPGMPIGSPGMEMGERVDDYEVLSFRRDGSTEVFARYPRDADEQ